MSKPIVEVATIRLKPGAAEADLVTASDAFQNFLGAVDGFIRRELLKRGETEYADLVHWRSQADADAMMAAAATSSECAAYFALMDIDGSDPSEEVRHFTSLATYGAL